MLGPFLRALSADPPGSQWLALFNAAEDDTNDAGWRSDAFRVAAVVTDSAFASATGFDSTVSSLLLCCPG